MKASVSVIIPVYNSRCWLPTTIQSCLDQGDPLREIIAVDDHSADGSWEWLQEKAAADPRLKVFRNPDKGANTARNFGFAQSSGNYIQWLDADDQLLSGKLTAQVTFLEEHPDVDVVYSDIEIRIYSNETEFDAKGRLGADGVDYLRALLLDKWLSPNAYLLRREASLLAAQNNGWNPATPVHQDTEYFTKLAIAGGRFAYLPGVFATYSKWSGESISQAHYRKKAAVRFGLYEQFRSLIQVTEHIKPELKKEYTTIINTHLLQLAFYAPWVQPTAGFSYRTVRPSIVETRARYVLFPVWCWLMVKSALRA